MRFSQHLGVCGFRVLFAGFKCRGTHSLISVLIRQTGARHECTPVDT